MSPPMSSLPASMSGESVAEAVGKRHTTTPVAARSTANPPFVPPVSATRSPATSGAGCDPSPVAANPLREAAARGDLHAIVPSRRAPAFSATAVES